jgi:hypothetical protein
LGLGEKSPVSSERSPAFITDRNTENEQSSQAVDFKKDKRYAFFLFRAENARTNVVEDSK